MRPEQTDEHAVTELLLPELVVAKPFGRLAVVFLQDIGRIRLEVGLFNQLKAKLTY